MRCVITSAFDLITKRQGLWSDVGLSRRENGLRGSSLQSGHPSTKLKRFYIDEKGIKRKSDEEANHDSIERHPDRGEPRQQACLEPEH